jgi:hypothetical protein
MSKKRSKLSMPKADRAAEETFVQSGSQAVRQSRLSAAQKAERQQTVYLLPETKEWLHLESVRRKQTVSDLVQEAVELLRSGSRTT